MEKDTIKVKLLRSQARAPTKERLEDVGYDLYSPETFSLKSGESKLVKLGISMADFPEGTYGRIAPRSGAALKGIHIMGGVIDSNYRGEIGVIMHYIKDGYYFVEEGDRIAQLIFEKCVCDRNIEIVESLDDTNRGVNGFGSSGK